MQFLKTISIKTSIFLGAIFILVIRLSVVEATATTTTTTNINDPLIAKISQVAVGNSQTMVDLRVVAEKVRLNTEALVKPQERAFRIIRYLEQPGAQPLVLFAGGSNDGIIEGATMESYRGLPALNGKKDEKIWIQTGKLKIIELKPTYGLAVILSNGTLASQSLFPKYPEIMASDWMAESDFRLTRNQVITPTKTIFYNDIFQDPKAFPTTFELTEKGKAQIETTLAHYKDLRLPLLMIEAYTDSNGPTETNQIESYQRAVTIRQYVIEELGFDPARVVAIGYGESEPLIKDFTPGYIEKNRRIVFKANALRNNHKY